MQIIHLKRQGFECRCAYKWRKGLNGLFVWLRFRKVTCQAFPLYRVWMWHTGSHWHSCFHDSSKPSTPLTPAIFSDLHQSQHEGLCVLSSPRFKKWSCTELLWKSNDWFSDSQTSSSGNPAKLFIKRSFWGSKAWLCSPSFAEVSTEAPYTNSCPGSCESSNYLWIQDSSRWKQLEPSNSNCMIKIKNKGLFISKQILFLFKGPAICIFMW